MMCQINLGVSFEFSILRDQNKARTYNKHPFLVCTRSLVQFMYYPLIETMSKLSVRACHTVLYILFPSRFQA